MVDMRRCAKVEGLHHSPNPPLLCDERLDGLMWDDFITSTVQVKLWIMRRIF